jgi:hypothetical protein
VELHASLEQTVAFFDGLAQLHDAIGSFHFKFVHMGWQANITGIAMVAVVGMSAGNEGLADEWRQIQGRLLPIDDSNHC